MPGALPIGQNSPQRCPYGLYAEQLSGSAFTAPPGANRRSWLYRIRPSVLHARRFRLSSAFPLENRARARDSRSAASPRCAGARSPLPDQRADLHRRRAHHDDRGDADWQSRHVGGILSRHALDGRRLISTTPTANFSFVPQQGRLIFDTEMGIIDVAPGEICVIPRGVKFRVDAVGRPCPRIFLRELWRALLTLPNRGVIGANGLAKRARLSDAGRRFRGHGCALPTDRQMGRRVLQLRPRSLAARRRRLAWELRAV